MDMVNGYLSGLNLREAPNIKIIKTDQPFSCQQIHDNKNNKQLYTPKDTLLCAPFTTTEAPTTTQAQTATEAFSKASNTTTPPPTSFVSSDIITEVVFYASQEEEEAEMLRA
ncbi:hypothetical protein DPMN_131896 [Dreissena polymorpha]|uniref:Uncharacterized protein n=1 Tax=Dreissena polymorpha TaxID=45954 RepID=A0A9D4J9K8_DREPO|nr:hypothetical protein DPMN_131896 [Dreissena polymorpha]